MTQEFVTLPREVLEQALEGLIMGFAMYPNGGTTRAAIAAAIKELRAALKQPQGEQEPVGFVRQIDIEQIAKTPSDWGAMFGKVMGFNTVPVYTHPQPKREPLTEDEIDKLCPQFDDPMRREMWIIGFKAAHNIK